MAKTTLTVNRVRWFFCDPGWQGLCPCGWESLRGPMNLVDPEVKAHKEVCGQAEGTIEV